MKLFAGGVVWTGVLVSAMAAAAQAQPLPSQTGRPAYTAASDVGGPYTEMAPEYLPQRYAPLLPPREVYMIARENGFAPLGAPQQRGVFYTLAVIDGYGDDGRLVVDARNGRIVQFQPAMRTGERMGSGYVDEAPMLRPPASVPTAPMPRPQAALPPAPMSAPVASPRSLPPPPRRLASQSAAGMQLPKPPPRVVAEPAPPRPAEEPSPARAAEPKSEAPPVAAAPAPAPAPTPAPAPAPAPQQSAAAQPAEATAAATTGQGGAKPSIRILPTQPMPQAQGLD